MPVLTSAVTASGSKLAIGDAFITAVLGYAVVFVGLALLMAVVIIIGKVMVSSEAKKKAAEPVKAPSAPAPAPEKPKAPAAPGTAGEVKLYDTSDKDAAMIMAIVANKMGKPINELRFKSIKEVK